jgi:hypothetical protein
MEFFYTFDSPALSDEVGAIIGFARPSQDYWLTGDKITPFVKERFFLQGLADVGEDTFFSTRFQKSFISWMDIGAPDLS